ncbi:THO complex subunit, partial [Brachionus plicatilis]
FDETILKFKIEQKKFQDNKIYVPLDLKKFLHEYKNSEFLECSYSLTKKNFNNFGYVQYGKKSLMFSEKLKYIAQTLESLGVEYWLAGGTLLGWYRDCGFIPHTTDLDIGLFSQQHDSRVKKSFLGNKKAALIVEFGFPNDSYELRLDSEKLQIDLFYFYDLNSTHHWCGYQEKRVKKRRFLTKSNLCSGELFGQKYLVPCRVENYLNEEYGTNLWKVPKTNDYVWSNLVYWKNWTEAEWLNAIKFYHQDGSFLAKETLDYINIDEIEYAYPNRYSNK